jgi:hypothetical protein
MGSLRSLRTTGRAAEREERAVICQEQIIILTPKVADILRYRKGKVPSINMKSYWRYTLVDLEAKPNLDYWRKMWGL